ncbi:transcriptional regulator [Candidatus Woesearchaeota archaeon]|nr:MAG: transcriptional regulator [Candidatus Woesearchaeota archaeon]
MRFHYSKITIIRSDKPKYTDINQKLQWFGSSLGLFNLRDKDKSCFRIFIVLVKSRKIGKPMSSDEIAFESNLSRGTVVHHLNKLMDSGIVISKNNKYYLAVDNLAGLVDLVQDNLNKACAALKDVAKDIDEQLGL